jgi:hypothetical protein
MAFSDEMIRAIAATGQYSDAGDPKLLAEVLIQRRDRIGRAYLNAINPVVNVTMDASGAVAFENAAVAAKVGAEPAGGYSVNWASFDNTTGRVTPIGGPVSTTDRRAKAPQALPAGAGAIVRVQIAAVKPENPSWARPIDVYFRRSANAWTVVGVERLPQQESSEKK